MLQNPKEIVERRIECLTQTQASLRSRLILAGSVNYTLSVKLMKGKQYECLLSVRFFSLWKSDEIFLDFCGKKIMAMHLNGESVQSVDWDGNFLKLSNVRQGRNEVLIYYQNNYDNDGNGLHSFVDEDGKQYLYTNLAVIYCRRVFPCFDQPDLKGSFKLQAIAPKDWIVLSNESPSLPLDVTAHFQSSETPLSSQFVQSILPENGNYALTIFPESKPLSSYLFGIMAGPYSEIKCPLTYKNIPMSLFTRESLMPHLRRISEFLFEVTNKCMEVYEKIFGYSFPFNKYDQIYVPEFNWGAMENAGIVTFNDIYVYREEVDSVKLTKLANTTSHELSHHWFGNLVTMKWWNDVWLNESFADFISHYCLSQFQTTSRPMSDIWVAFNARKAWGYRTDEQVTTHPIAGLVPDTNTAECVFDGITYAKGAATIRQLFSLVSVDLFSKAMHEYFNKFAFGNATLSDFINTVDDQFQKSGSSFSLSKWQKTWIGKAGLNKCCPVFEPMSKDQESQLIIKQTCTLDMHPTLRNHKMKIAFFDEHAQIVHTKDILIQDQPETLITYDGSKADYKAVLLNYEDEAFIKIAFDDHSIEFFKTNLNLISCELSRTLIWSAFYNMVRDGELQSEEYIELFLNHINLEKSDGLISNQLAFLETALSSFTPAKYQKVLGDRIFDFLWEMLEKTDKSAQNKRLAVIGYLPNFIKSEKSARRLLEWYHEKETCSFEKMGLKTQWQTLTSVFNCREIPNEEKEKLFDDQSHKDKSDQVPLYEQFCKAVLATPEQRKIMWDNIIDPKNPLSTRLLEYAMMGIRFYATSEEMMKYHLLWIQQLPYVFANCKRELFKAFVSYLIPSQEAFDEAFNKELLSAIQVNTEDAIHKVLLDCQDNNTRKQRAIATFLAKSKLSKL